MDEIGMTTIATDGKTIAGDGLHTYGGEVCGLNNKKIRVLDGRIYAFSGSSAMFDPAVEWHRAGAEPKDLPKVEGDDPWRMLVIDHSGITRYASFMPYPEKFDPPVAIGAGEDFVLGAMRFGASPEEAVRLVAKHHVHTGGEIQVVDIAEALGIVKPNGSDEKLYGHRPSHEYRVEWRAY